MSASKIKSKKGFIDFMVDAEQDRPLGLEFMMIANAAAMKSFFDSHGYNVTKEEVDKILGLRTKLATRTNLRCIDDYY